MFIISSNNGNVYHLPLQGTNSSTWSLGFVMEQTTDTVDWSTQGQTILTDITDPQPSGTSNITSVVQFIPHQCNTCVL